MNKYNKHNEAINYALDKIKKSSLSEYIQEVILFGSVARNEERFDSDIDLLLVLDNDAKFHKREILNLKSDVTSDELEAADVDLKITYNKNWRESTETIFLCIRKDGIKLW